MTDQEHLTSRADHILIPLPLYNKIIFNNHHGQISNAHYSLDLPSSIKTNYYQHLKEEILILKMLFKSSKIGHILLKIKTVNNKKITPFSSH